MSDDYTPPGWYHAFGDPAGTHRYWDGEMWQGEPEPLPPSTEPFAPGPPRGPRPASYAEASQATTALVMSLAGFFCCGVMLPVGWKLGHDEVTAIDAGRRDPINRGKANAGRLIGMIGTILIGLVLVGYVILLAVSTPGP